MLFADLIVNLKVFGYLIALCAIPTVILMGLIKLGDFFDCHCSGNPLPKESAK